MSTDEMITVLIKTIDNSSYNVNIQNSSTVSSLKTIIREQTSVQEDRQRLIYRGRVLLDSSIIQECHIENGHTIHMVARPENYQELQQAAQANSILEENQAAATARGVVASLLSSLPILTDARGNAANNANNIASDTNMEHIRQSLLTMHTLISIVDPPVPELVPIDDVPVQDNVKNTLNSHEKGNEDTDISHDGGATSTTTIGTLSSSSLRGGQVGGGYQYIKPIQFYIGQWVDVKDTVAQWLEATVMDINHDDKKVFIHYNGWPERWDEWIIWDSPRICPFRSRTSHTAITASPNTHLNHFSPQPNIAIAHAPITGVNDIRILLPEIASMFRRILPFVEEAASLAEESLQSKPPSATQDPLLRSLNPRSNISFSIPYRRTSVAPRAAVSSSNSSSISSVISPNSLHPLQATTTSAATNSSIIQPIAGITPRMAPGMPWEYVGHPYQPYHNRNTSIYNMQIDNEVIVEKRHIVDNTRSDYVDETSNYLSLESDLNERNRRQRLCTRSVDDITVRSSASAADDAMINYKDNIQSNESNIHFNNNSNNKIDVNNMTSSYIEENISNSYSTRKRPAESNMQPRAWNNNNNNNNNNISSNQLSSKYSTNNRNTDECITQDYREKRLRILAQDLCPLLDRFGRMLSDVAPHLWNLSEEPLHTDTNTTNNNTTNNTVDTMLRENEVSNITRNDSSTVSRGLDHIDSSNSNSTTASNRGDAEATIPVVSDSQFSLEASLLSLLRERPVSPPHDRIARAPIALNTRIGMGILPSSIGGGSGGGGGGVTARGSTAVAVAGNNALLQSLLGDMAAEMSGNATTAMTSGTHSSSSSGGATVLRSTGTNAPTMVTRNGRQVDIHIAILAPASARMASNNSLPSSAANTTAVTASSSHINQRAATLSSSLQVQAENLATRTRQLSERTQQMTGYSAAINDVLRSLREQTNQTNTSNTTTTTTTIDPSMNVVIADSSNDSLLGNIESNNDDDDVDECINDENDEHLLDDLIPSLSFTHDSSNNLESHRHNNDITNTHNILPINTSESRSNHIDIAIMNDDEIMNTIVNTTNYRNNQHQHNHQYSESHTTALIESITTTTTASAITIIEPISIATTATIEEPIVLSATSIEPIPIPIVIEDDQIDNPSSSLSPSAPVSNTVYDRLRSDK